MKCWHWYLVLQLIFMLYACCALLGKLAGTSEFLSPIFIICYGTSLGCMAVYAIVWQQVIKHLPLSSAFACKAVTVLWGMLFGVLFFDESISLRQLVGAALIMGGIVIFSWSLGHRAVPQNHSGQGRP